MRDIDLAYIAGFIDGEGCMRIGRVKTKSSYSYFSQVSICNTDLNILNWIKDLFELGSIIPHKKKVNKNVYELVFNIKAVKKILPKIKPFIRIKADQLLVIEEFIAMCNGKLTSPENLILKEKLYWTARELKRR